ncbi:hypothetical protein CSPAE12_02423, partial [Colletotrichum incanum]
LLRLAACLGFRKLGNLFVSVKPKLFVVSDALESALDTYKRGIVEELQFIQVPNDVDWSLYGLSDKFLDLGPLVQASGSKVSASRNSPGAAVRSTRGS